MPVVGFNHIQIAVPPGRDGEVRGFYGGCLGLVEVPKPAHLAVRGGVWFTVGTQQLHVGVEAEFRAARRAHPAFQVTALDALRARIDSYGLATVDGDPLPGHRRFYADDPFGNRLEFDEPV